jgi:MFS transporter, ACDE family, multidrug resistance protein
LVDQVLRSRNLHLVFGTTLMAVLGVASIAPALPRIAQALEVTPQQVGLLITAFTVPGVLLTPIAGVLADRAGRKRVLVPSLLIFGLAGAACALAGSFEQLLLLRLLQGVGAAALGSMNVTLIGDLFQGRERAAAMGYNATVLSIGTGTYPALGGLLAQLGWRYPFLLPLLAVPIAAAVLFGLRNPEPARGADLREYLGEVWQSVRNRAVAGMFAISVLTFVLLYGSILTYLPILMDRRFGAAPALIGLVMSTQSLATALASSQLGRLSGRLSPRALILIAFALYALALALVPLMPSLWLLVVPASLFGVGMGLNLPSLMTLLSGMAPLRHRAALMSLNGMVLRLGQTLGPLVAGGLYVWGGLSAPFWGGAVLGLASLLVVGVTLRGLQRPAASSGTAPGIE